MTPFKEWLELQHRLQVESFNLDPTTLEEDARAEFIRWNALALHDELSEALQEVGWKPWASSRHLNREAFLRELVDLLHFAGNLVLAAGGTAEELWEMYTAKHAENARRQRDGYTGRDEKCPICGRELPQIEISSMASEEPEIIYGACPNALDAEHVLVGS